MSKSIKKIIVINSPNLNNLGKRNNNLYGNESLDDVENKMIKNAKENNFEISFFSQIMKVKLLILYKN